MPISAFSHGFLMTKLSILKTITTKPEFAKLLGINSSFLTRNLYMISSKNQYHQFDIPKKTGGFRTINAPSPELKSIQKHLSDLLLDCVDEINKNKFPNSLLAKPRLKSNGEPEYVAKILKIKVPSTESKQPSLSHGFVRHRSIITNAMMHLGKKNVLNIDLESFFDSFNFGRVRGFFIKNKNFELNENIATVIAQIACFDNKLPQGSPCSPVIANLITHSLDIRLAAIAKKNDCTYTRYADDITISTNKPLFPEQIMIEDAGVYTPSNKFRKEIERSGFSINNKKTRIQHCNSRQEVTGLIVNKKPNSKKEYWRTIRARCNSLFNTGSFYTIKDNKEVKGDIAELEGQLKFIDQIDHYNRLRQKPPLQPEYALKQVKQNTKSILSGREKTFSQFMFYKLFWGNDKPTILCEGKTDNMHLKSAISALRTHYPVLATTKSTKYELMIMFVEYTKRTKFLLELFGGSSYLKGFIINYSKNIKLYEKTKPKNPVIIFSDNDDAFGQINSALNGYDYKIFPDTIKSKSDIRKSEFIHITDNLYLIFTPLASDGSDTDIEYFYDNKARMMKHSCGKYFNTVKDRDTKNDLSKDSFASLMRENKKIINFNGFKPLLNSIEKIIAHYKSIK